MKKNIISIFISIFTIVIIVEFLLSTFYKKRLYKFDQSMGWNLKKNIKAKRHSSGKKYEIFTDKYSLRSNIEKNILKEPCDFNYVFLGDSFVFGVGVDLENRFDILLKNEKGIKSINFGVPGYSILQSYMKQKHHINYYNCTKPKKLIILIYKNDLKDAQTTHTALRPRPLIINQKIKFPDTLSDIINGNFRDLSYGYFFLKSTIQNYSNQKISYEKDNISALINEINYILEDTIHHDLFIVIHGMEENNSNKILKNNVCNKITCSDLKISQKSDSDLYIKKDSHWNENGHEYLSKYLFENVLN